MKIIEIHNILSKEEVLQRYEGYLFDPDYIIDEEHVIFAYIHMKKAFEKKRNIAKDPRIEFLLRLSGETQISKAMEIGVKDNMKRLGILIPEEEGISEIKGKMEKIKSFFGTTDKKEIFEKIAVMEIL
ncbi:MAG: hypothetical protein J7J21_01415 [Methanomicrobia archaeon]|nr:hypothetical protein [Methanomicrobia archaeon]